MDRDEEDRSQALAMVPVSRETLSRLDRFVSLLLKWQHTINLIAPSTASSVWVRHVADSLQLLDLAAARHKSDAPIWVDLGSGGGFPGMPIACALADIPDACVHLVESNAKKAAFLREAIRETGAAAAVHLLRIEDLLAPHRLKSHDGHDLVRNTQGGADLVSRADFVTARALAPLNRLLPIVLPFVEKGAQALLLKGQDVERELTEATKYWTLQLDVVPSKTSAAGRVLIVRDLARKADRPFHP